MNTNSGSKNKHLYSILHIANKDLDEEPGLVKCKNRGSTPGPSLGKIMILMRKSTWDGINKMYQ